MKIFNNKAELTTYLATFLASKKTIGFVPTMGALHKGHLSLIETALQNNDLAVMSIFVNPTQFNNPEDLKKYPRTLETDVEKIKTISDKVIVYAPTVDDIYEGKTVSKKYKFDGLEHQMEGKFRPGHFDGVGTVVQKLFEIVKPTNAYFGEKDFQQLQIIKKLVSKYKIDVNVHGCSIFREENGLAMSSRNERLSKIERENAKIIFETLTKAKLLFGTESASEVTDFVTKTFENNKMFTLEYFTIASENSLKTCFRKNKSHNYRGFIAVFVNSVRLIDTIAF